MLVEGLYTVQYKRCTIAYMVQCYANDRFHQIAAPKLRRPIDHSTWRSTFDGSGANVYLFFLACHLYEHHLSLMGQWK